MRTASTFTEHCDIGKLLRTGAHSSTIGSDCSCQAIYEYFLEPNLGLARLGELLISHMD